LLENGHLVIDTGRQLPSVVVAAQYAFVVVQIEIGRGHPSLLAIRAATPPPAGVPIVLSLGSEALAGSARNRILILSRVVLYDREKHGHEKR
jgi:hypothetical protein